MNTVTLNFRADGQQLVLTGSERFAANTVSYIRAAFELGDGWDGFDSIRAIWATDFAKFSTVLDPDGVCVVPWEVLKRVDTVMVNLVGSISDGEELTDRLTTYKVKALDVNGCTNIDGSETAEITPSQFEQFVAIVKEEVGKVKDISDVKLNADYTLTFLFSDGTEWTTPIPIRGEQGAKGDTGNGISDIKKIGSQGRIDTYRITYTNGGHFDFEVTNGAKGEQGETGNGIDRIEKTATVGSVDTYTIYFTDGSTTTFDITNGEVTTAQFEKAFPTDTASGSIASFPDGSDLFPMKSLKVSLEPVQDLSHGDPSPSNICPISGWDRVQAVRTGKNLWNYAGTDKILNGYYISSSGSNGTIAAGTGRGVVYIPCKPNTMYTLSRKRVQSNERFYAGTATELPAPNVSVSQIAIAPNSGTVGDRMSITITTSADAKYLVAWLWWDSHTETVEDLQIELGSTATDYEPYNGTTYTADLPQTVYGGWVDLATGQGEITWKYVNLADYVFAKYSSSTSYYQSFSDKKMGVENIKSDMFDAEPVAIANLPNGGMRGRVDAKYVYFGTNFETAADFNSWVQESQPHLLYELAEPIPFTIDPQTIQTLQGTNNVWSDGDVEVEYKADVQLWVEKKLAG